MLEHNLIIIINYLKSRMSKLSKTVLTRSGFLYRI